MNGTARVLITGANGLVGSALCSELAERGADVRAVVRRSGTAPKIGGVTELVGEFGDADFAARAVSGVAAEVTTVHPMGSDRDTQHRVAVQGTPVLARAAAAEGVQRLVHISTAAVYDRSPGIGNIDESSALVDDDADDYAVTKRDTDLALAEVSGITRVLLRPPAILGPGKTSIWNTVRPARMREDVHARRATPDASFAWVHLSDLVALAADLATGQVADADQPDDGPVHEGCTPLNVAAGPATQRDYFTAVSSALEVDPIWEDAAAWTGRIIADRARGWGWAPRVGLAEALEEVAAGIRSAA